MKNYILRHYQENAANAAMQAIQKGNKRISLEMAPGTGKTFVLTALVEHLLNTNTKVLIVTNTKQEEDQIRTFLMEQLNSSIATSFIKENVLVTLYPRVRKNKDRQWLENFTYVFLLDFVEGSTYNCYFSNINSTLIGFLSGKKSLNVRDETDNDRSSRSLFSAQDCVFRYSLSEAVQQGVLSPMIDPAMYEPAAIGFCQRLFTKLGGQLLRQDSTKWSFAARVDLEILLGNRKVSIECKVGRYDYMASHALNLALSRMTKSNDSNVNDDISLLIIIGKVTEQEKITAYEQHGINVWDISNLLYYVQHDDYLYEELSKLSYFPLSGIVAVPPIGWIPDSPATDYSPLYILKRSDYLKNNLRIVSPVTIMLQCMKKYAKT